MLSPKTEQELIKQVKIDKIQYLRCEYCDINGRSFSRLVPVRHLVSILKNGFHIYSATWFMTPVYTPYLGLNSSYGNVVTYPYIDTYAVLTHIKTRKVARLMFYAKRYDVCPRQQLLRQIKKLKDEYGLELYSCFEHEFVLLNKETKEPIWKNIEFSRTVTMTKFQDFMFDVEENLYNMGVDLEVCYVKNI